MRKSDPKLETRYQHVEEQETGFHTYRGGLTCSGLKDPRGDNTIECVPLPINPEKKDLY